MGKGADKNCATGGFSPLSAAEEQALQYADELQVLRDSLDSDATAALVAPTNAEMEKVASLYGRDLLRLHHAGARRRSGRTVNDGGDMFRQMVDANVIADPALLKEFSRQAGIVLRHHPDYHVRRQAAGMLIFCNERAAQQIARKWHNRWRTYGFAYDDMLQEAQIGLAEAAEDRDGKRRRVWEDYRRAHREWEADGKALGKAEPKPPTEKDMLVFDPEQASFLTFAMQKMTMRIRRMVENNSEQRFGHRISTDRFTLVGKVLSEKGKLEAKQNEDVTAEMLLAQPGMADFAPGKTPEQRLALCQECLDMTTLRGVRLNERVRAGDDSEFTERGALLEDVNQDTAAEAEESVLFDNVRDAMKEHLSPEECHYLGAIDFEGRFDEWPIAENDAELAERLGVKPSRVKAVRKEARTKLRALVREMGFDAPADPAE